MNMIIVQSASQRRWAGGVHLAALLTALLTSWAVGLGGMAAALVVWFLVRDDREPFAQGHAAEAFNFNFSMLIYTVVGIALGSVVALLIGVLTLGVGLVVLLPLFAAIAAAAALIWVYCSLRAAYAGFKGQSYTYPLTFDLLR